MTADRDDLRTMRVADVIRRWRPGSHDYSDGPEGANHTWTWADEQMYLLTEQHDYQHGLMIRARAHGSVDWVDPFAPICLGNDGRVWDGHHRICAAMALGFETIEVDVVPEAQDYTLGQALADLQTIAEIERGDAHAWFHKHATRLSLRMGIDAPERDWDLFPLQRRTR